MILIKGNTLKNVEKLKSGTVLGSLFGKTYSKDSVDKVITELETTIELKEVENTNKLTEIRLLKNKIEELNAVNESLHLTITENASGCVLKYDEIHALHATDMEELKDKHAKVVKDLNGTIKNRDASIVRLNDTVSKVRATLTEIKADHKTFIKKLVKTHNAEIAISSNDCAKKLLKKARVVSKAVTGKLSGKRSFTCKQIKDFFNRNNNGEAIKDIAASVNVSSSTISRIIKGDTYKDCK